MTPNETKTLRQQKFVNEKWFQANGKGIFVAATGFGKSRVALMAIKLSNERAPERVIHVVVPSTHLKKSWEKQCKDWGFTNVTVFVGNTYVKLMRTCDFLIIDEFCLYYFNCLESPKASYTPLISNELSIVKEMKMSNGQSAAKHPYGMNVQRLSAL